MENKSFGKSLMVVAFSRMVSLLSGVLVGFLLPKIFSVTDYGFYKVFTLYAVYTALLHFGFVDGMLLKIAGTDYKDLSLPKMRAYTRFFFYLETAVALLMVLVGVVFVRGEYLFILLMLALNMLFVNVTTYYQFVSQAVQRFGEYSAKNLIVAVVKIVFVILLFALQMADVMGVSYHVYLIGLNVVDGAVMLWYVSIYRDITFGSGDTIRSVRSDIRSIFKTGILLTLAYQVSHLILALDRQFVNVLFSTEDFAVYSFAYNIVTMISTMISSISIVLLPMLKKRTRDLVVRSYPTCSSTVAMVAGGGLLCYFPLVWFVGWFLPQYSGAMAYVSVVLPAFLFSSVITVVMFTVDKALDMSLDFFREGCVVLGLGLVTNVAAYLLWRTPMALSYASLLVMMVWFLLSGLRLGKRIGIGVMKEFFYLMLLAVGFLTVTALVEGLILGLALYTAWFAVWTMVFYFERLRQLAVTVKHKLYG